MKPIKSILVTLVLAGITLLATGTAISD